MNKFNSLILKAKEAADRAYAPYSKFRVGAALLCKTGEIITGANIENRSYGLTNCAERSALFAAVSEGKTDFDALAIYSPDSEGPIPPCGACRQVISEFVSKDFPVLFSGKSGEVTTASMEELLPYDSLHDLAE